MVSKDFEYLNTLYGASEDPWRMRSGWQTERQRDVLLACLNQPRYGKAFQPSCAAGELTTGLARRTDRILAADDNRLALSQARTRTAHLSNVDVQFWPRRCATAPRGTRPCSPATGCTNRRSEFWRPRPCTESLTVFSGWSDSPTSPTPISSSTYGRTRSAPSRSTATWQDRAWLSPTPPAPSRRPVLEGRGGFR